MVGLGMLLYGSVFPELLRASAQYLGAEANWHRCFMQRWHRILSRPGSLRVQHHRKSLCMGSSSSSGSGRRPCWPVWKQTSTVGFCNIFVFRHVSTNKQQIQIPFSTSCMNHIISYQLLSILINQVIFYLFTHHFSHSLRLFNKKIWNILLIPIPLTSGWFVISDWFSPWVHM